MRRAVLLYNPQSGRHRSDLVASVERAAVALRAAGVDATVVPTVSAAAAGRQAQDAVAEGCDTVFACGGDGTIMGIAQGVIGSSAALAVIPLGTANVLAHDLGIPRDTVAAARAALRAIPLRVSVGRIDCKSKNEIIVTRYFLTVAGVGQDGYLFHRLASEEKQTFGMGAYFLKALQVWLTHRMEWFSASCSAATTGNTAPPHQITQLLAVRLHNFGNLLRDLAPGASLLRDDLHVVLFKTASRWTYLLYVIRGIVGARWMVSGIEMINANHIRLTPDGKNPVYIEADGELLGQLPAEISVVPDALTLLVPQDFASRQPD